MRELREMMAPGMFWPPPGNPNLMTVVTMILNCEIYVVREVSALSSACVVSTVHVVPTGVL